MRDYFVFTSSQHRLNRMISLGFSLLMFSFQCISHKTWGKTWVNALK